jgi:uncharacterized surface protein with fasciclin (FAS1) repeats
MIPSLKSALLAVSLVAVGNAAFAEGASKDIVDTAISAGNFTTLVKALQTADLVKTLKGNGPFTVFAPDDAAFAKIPSTTLNDILSNKARLVNLLKYHVVRAKVDSREATRVGTVNTLEGDVLTITANGKTLTVEGATITKPDIQCKNGIIHVIDTVLQPTDKLQ